MVLHMQVVELVYVGFLLGTELSPLNQAPLGCCNFPSDCLTN